MILVFDIGNSRIKWKLVTLQYEAVLADVFDPGEGIAAFTEKVSKYSVSRIWVAEVGDVLRQYSLLDALRAMWPSSKVTEVSSQCECLGVRNSYQEPQRLGVDRWLASIEAWHCSRGQPVAVFDLGTAAKLDVVAEGMHLGGHIVPGLNMMRDTLRKSTKKVRFDPLKSYCVGWGESTATAVENGTWVMLLAWVKAEAGQFYQCYPDGVIYLAGGDAEPMLNALEDQYASVQLHKNLVVDALLRLDRQI